MIRIVREMRENVSLLYTRTLTPPNIFMNDITFFEFFLDILNQIIFYFICKITPNELFFNLTQKIITEHCTALGAKVSFDNRYSESPNPKIKLV